jgi:hypothetical protein
MTPLPTNLAWNSWLGWQQAGTMTPLPTNLARYSWQGW